MYDYRAMNVADYMQQRNVYHNFDSFIYVEASRSQKRHANELNTAYVTYEDMTDKNKSTQDRTKSCRIKACYNNKSCES